MEKETFVDTHLAYICSRNDITVPVLLSCEPDATLPLGSGGNVHACCVTVQATANASTDGFDMLSCSPEDASELFQVEKLYNSCSKSIERKTLNHVTTSTAPTATLTIKMFSILAVIRKNLRTCIVVYQSGYWTVTSYVTNSPL